MFFGQSQRRGGLGSCRGIFIKTHRTSRERDAKSSRRGARRLTGELMRRSGARTLNCSPTDQSPGAQI
jgi:hypothetical protein